MSIRRKLPFVLAAFSLVLVMACKTAPEPAPEPDAETAASEPWEG